MALAERPDPHAAENDVVVEVRAAGFTPGELEWPATRTDRASRDRTPSIPARTSRIYACRGGQFSAGVPGFRREVEAADADLAIFTPFREAGWLTFS